MKLILLCWRELIFWDLCSICNYLRGRGVFLNCRSMDNLFLNRVNSWQGFVKKEQESIFEKSIGLPYNLQFLLKMRFWQALVLSNDP